MHTVGARGKSDIETIVDEQSRRTAARDLHSTSNEFIEHSCGQVLFTDLKKRNLTDYCGFDQVQNECKFRVVSSCVTARRAARYLVKDWAWKCGASLFYRVTRSRFLPKRRLSV